MTMAQVERIKGLSYRAADLADTAAVFELLAGKFWPEHKLGSNVLPIDILKTRQAILSEFLNGVIFIAEVGDEVVGTLGIHPFAPWWTSETILADTWFFVDAEYRKGGVAKRLLRMAKDHALSAGKPLIVGVYNSHDTARKDVFFTRSGFERIGGWYLANGG